MNEEEGQQDVAGIPARGILLGAVLALLLNGLDAYATTIIRGSYLTLNFSTPAALFFFFFLVPASGLVYCLRRSLALTQSELITIYIMLVVACCIPGMGFTQFIIPCLVGSTYYATPENNWDFLYNQYIPTWMIPRGENVARYFFEGLPEGVATIPWGAWVLPLTYWYGFFLALSAAMICTMVILRKQWVDREKLAYPLVQVPMEMIKREEGRAIGRAFFTNKAMWLGFAFSFVLLSVNGLHTYFPGGARDCAECVAPFVPRYRALRLVVQPAVDRLLLLCQLGYFRVYLGVLHADHDATGRLQYPRDAKHGSGWICTRGSRT